MSNLFEGSTSEGSFRAASSSARHHLAVPFPPPPPRYSLVFVQILTRHGERSPLIFPFKNMSFTLGGVGMCSNESELSKMQGVSDFSGQFRLSYPDRNVRGHLGNCFPGQLTDEGKANMFRLGLKSRGAYGKSLALGKIPDSSEIYIRSTDIPRTIESAQNFVQGLFPEWKSEDPKHALDIIVREERFETLYPNMKCAALREEFNKAKEAALTAQSAEAAKISEKLKHEIDPSQSKKSTVHTIYDSIACSEAHGIPVPPEATPSIFSQAESMLIEQWWKVFLDSPKARKLGIGQLVGTLAEQLEQKSKNAHRFKIAIYSGHDSTIAPFLTAYEVFDSRWPPFGANIAIELYERDSQASPMHFVRLVYNSKVLSIPGCQKDAEEGGSLCPLNTFLEISRKLIPQNYSEDCKLSRK